MPHIFPRADIANQLDRLQRLPLLNEHMVSLYSVYSSLTDHTNTKRLNIDDTVIRLNVIHAKVQQLGDKISVDDLNLILQIINWMLQELKQPIIKKNIGTYAQPKASPESTQQIEYTNESDFFSTLKAIYPGIPQIKAIEESKESFAEKLCLLRENVDALQERHADDTAKRQKLSQVEVLISAQLTLELEKILKYKR